MASVALGQRAVRRNPFVCRQCLVGLSRTSRRQISGSWLTREVEKEISWKERAKLIRNGERKSMLSTLEERGFIYQIAGGRDQLDNLMTEKRIGAYCGVDPTAPSLHVGHLLPMMCLFWMYIHGMSVVSLVGGATARIGDPTGRNTPRQQMKAAERVANITAITQQLKSLWKKVEALAAKQGYEKDLTWRRSIRNNNEWHSRLTLVDFLRDIGGAFRIGEMLSRDTVKSRMDNGEGMSFGEFTYPLIQAWDFWELYNQLGIQLQIGGSDQYGNIVAGIDAVNHLRKNTNNPVQRKALSDPLMSPYGFTVPLLTTSSGEKFGKSAGNAIWLDSNLTSSFDLYQFMVRTADADVERYLKLFTFYPLEEIAKVMKEHEMDQSKRVAQHLLAESFVELVHGAKVAQETAAEHRKVFGTAGKKVTLSELLGARAENTTQPSEAKKLEEPSEVKVEPAVEEQPQKPLRGQPDASFISSTLNKNAPQVGPLNMPSPSNRVFLPRSLVKHYGFGRLLHAVGLVGSRAEANRLIQAKGAYVGGAWTKGGVFSNDAEVKWTQVNTFANDKPEEALIDDSVLLLRSGKWNVRICEILDDEEFKRRGLSVNGWSWEAHEESIAHRKPKGAARGR